MTLIAENLTIKANKKVLLTEANFRCEAGEVIALCGPNGAGKSTLLKALSGDLAYQEGRIMLNNQRLSDYSHRELALNRAVMPQNIELHFPFSAQQVIEMALLFTENQTDKRTIIQQVAELLSLQNLLHRNYCMLSGGEKQRVQLGRVIAQLLQASTSEKKFLFLDECTSAMDMAMMHQAFSVLKDISQYGIGIIAVIHDLNLASLYADKIVMIKDQTTAFDGSPEKVITKEIITDVFSTNVSILPHPSLHCPVVLHAKAS